MSVLIANDYSLNLNFCGIMDKCVHGIKNNFTNLAYYYYFEKVKDYTFFWKLICCPLDSLALIIFVSKKLIGF